MNIIQESKNKNNPPEKIILGIDPGTNVMGYGLITVKGQKVISTLQYGVIHLSKYKSHELKLRKIFERVQSIVDEFHPDEVALEAPFFGKNVQSMLKLGRAQGVAMAAALTRDIPITEYAPRKVKQSVTGNGNATKEQVANMLASLLKLPEIPKMLDATDALGVALCHHYQGGKQVSKAKSWKTFLEDNPGRIKSGKTKK
ncbi:crossover junction endodeoxyribonuclease RuvC [Fulvitalea axinellae]|uniref:Crossover junction endodeoxyribonuclease RuvC n=1 Tax=Fulvitalea axinellae TaxID=1182444 RepID=A0AAU9CEM5_9BACT|nr:crossover junction endodeoxyribonuclease RuvC [Fulvitalea axinellae]